MTRTLLLWRGLSVALVLSVILPEPVRSRAESPDEALWKFTAADGLSLNLAVAEPDVAQPVYLTFDERGRMWVVQYLQYPFPAGLRVVGHDEYWRVKYDHFPPPAPPHHVPGADKITIFDDVNGDGRFEKVRDFATGLNICTAALPGRGGVWVLNPPYLLFYPDANRDDVADGDPVVHLEGFGMEDLHAVANSLTWGPDGWLYGCQGSTCTAAIRRPGLDSEPLSFKGQCIWRYQPETRRFELFAQGGFNNFGIAFNPQFELFTGSNGGVIGVHYVQHGYYRKIWGKHGPLTNPYALGWFNEMKDQSSGAKLSQAMIIYDGDALPQQYEGQMLAARVLQRRIDLCQLDPDGSTYSAREVRPILTSSDERFRPVDLKIGPDGAVYIADWNEENVTWNVTAAGKGMRKNTGRIYRLAAKGTPHYKPSDLSHLSSRELASKLDSRNIWERQMALRILWDRRDSGAAGQFEKIAIASGGQKALDAFWAAVACRGFDEAFAAKALRHPNPAVRQWAVRIAGEDNIMTSGMREDLVSLAVHEPDPHVRSQIASTAQALSPQPALRVIESLAAHREDEADPHLPLLIWWAVEAQLRNDPAAVLDWLRNRDTWTSPIFRKAVASRLAERFTLSRTPGDLETCARLLDLAPDAGSVSQLIAGMIRGLAGTRLEKIPEALAAKLRELKTTRFSDPNFLLLGLRLGQRDAVAAASQMISDTAAPEKERLALLQLLSETGAEEVVAPALILLKNGRSAGLRAGALDALQHFNDARIGDAVAVELAGMDRGLTRKALAMLTSRPSWSRALLHQINEKRFSARDVPLEIISALRTAGDAGVRTEAESIWGKSRASSSEKQQQVADLSKMIAMSKGNAEAGRALFTQLCANCHTMFGTGGHIGPDLTGIDRQNRESLLHSLADPSEVVLPEFQGMQVTMKEGAGDEGHQVITGFIESQNANAVTVKDVAGTKMVIPKDRIAKSEPMLVSIMPEGFLDQLSPVQVADLFAYLQSKTDSHAASH